MKYILTVTLISLLFLSKSTSPPTLDLEASLNIFNARYAGCDDANICYFDVDIPYFNTTSPIEFHTRSKSKATVYGYVAPNLLENNGESCLLFIDSILNENVDIYIQYKGKRGNVPIFKVWLKDGTSLEDHMTKYMAKG